MKFLSIRAAVAATAVLLLPGLHAQTKVDDALPDYVKVSGVSGTLSSVGSDTLANLMTLWGETYKRYYPNVTIQIQAAGSGTAPPSLSEGTADLGPMSRILRDTEIQVFEDRFGYKPTPVIVAIDALAVYVHKDNPIEGLTLTQADAIFSANRNCGASAAIDRWGQLGLTGSWADRDIQLYGRNSISGTYSHFKQFAMCHGDFRNSVNEQPGSASVVQSISSSLNGIGYSGIGYTTSSVRALPLARAEGKPFIEATSENALAGNYPLARFLYIYVNLEPGKMLTPVTGEFLNLVLSRQGQQVVVKDGYVPLPAPIAQQEAEKLARAQQPPEPLAE